jgi:hypothetical protein
MSSAMTIENSNGGLNFFYLHFRTFIPLPSFSCIFIQAILFVHPTIIVLFISPNLSLIYVKTF